MRRRLVLAASAALLALGSLFIGGKTAPNRTPGTPGIALPPGSATRDKLPPADKIKTSLSLEQDPMGTMIKVDVTAEEVPPPK
jgi:hypothetical protein